MTKRRDRIALALALILAAAVTLYAASVYREASCADRLKPTGSTARVAQPRR